MNNVFEYKHNKKILCEKRLHKFNKVSWKTMSDNDMTHDFAGCRLRREILLNFLRRWYPKPTPGVLLIWNSWTLGPFDHGKTRTDQNSSWKFYKILWPQIESFGLANWTKKVFPLFPRNISYRERLKDPSFQFFPALWDFFWKVFSPFLYFCYFWTLDMAPTYAVPGLLHFTLICCLLMFSESVLLVICVVHEVTSADIMQNLSYLFIQKQLHDLDRPKSAPYLRLKKSQRTSKCQSFGEFGIFHEEKIKSLTMPKKLIGRTLWDFSTPILLENSKTIGVFSKFCRTFGRTILVTSGGLEKNTDEKKPWQ